MRILRIFISIILIVVIMYAGIRVELKLNEYRTAQYIHVERTLESRKGRSVDFDKLKKQNADIKGWIWLEGTRIDYPIVQADDNDYYLHRDFDRNYLYDGCIFIDASVENPFSPDENTVIYGHRMSSGAMFHDLRKYEDEEFFRENGKIIIETEDGSYDLHVVAYCKELSDSELYTTGYAESTSADMFAPEDEDDDPFAIEPLKKEEFVQHIRNTARILSDEPFGTDDTFVTLSTCVFSDGDERQQVIGILKEAPSKEKVVETRTDKPFVNKWLVIQIGVGLVMAIAILALIIPKRRDGR